MINQLIHALLRIICPHWGRGETTEQLLPEPNRIVPHPGALRKAREQLKQMVIDGVSPCRISSYLYRWSTWWVRTTESWDYQDLLGWFLNACWEPSPAASFAAGLLDKAKKNQTLSTQVRGRGIGSGSSFRL